VLAHRGSIIGIVIIGIVGVICVVGVGVVRRGASVGRLGELTT
jgi:hypothetical protein